MTEISDAIEDVSRAERVFRGMLGMGMVFAVVAGAIACALAAGAMVFGPDTLNRDGLRFILTVFFLFLVGGFGLGMGYAGLLALLARGRSFRELSILPVATAGAGAGVIPLGVVVAATPAHGGLLALFPLASAVIATATLLIARRRVPSVATTLAVALTLAALRSSSAQQPARWLATWSPSVFAAPARPPADSVDRVPTFVDRTLRQIFRTTIGGDRVRIRFTNEFGDRPLVIGAAHIALRDTGASIRANTDKAVTFGGRTSVTLRRGAMITSDPVELRVPALTDVAVSIWVKDTIRASTRHPGALQTNYVSAPGDFTAAASMHADTTNRQWLWLAGADVVNANATGVIVAFGNSITDGSASSTDSNSRWPDVLARRLLASKEPAKAVVNAGIGGNGVIQNIAGTAALARYDRDVLMQPGVTHVILLEGINDLSRGAAPGNPYDSVGAQDIIYGYQQLISRAHERGIVIFGATLTPMGNMGRPVTDAVNARRKAVNEWIRTSGAFDGVIDFDAATRDPAAPDNFLPAYDSGDHLHPKDAGYKAMGESIDLRLFRKKTPARRP